MQENITYNIKESIERIKSYCATQERCKWDVKRKLKEWGVDPDSIKNIIKDLIQERFIEYFPETINKAMELSRGEKEKLLEKQRAKMKEFTEARDIFLKKKVKYNKAKQH